MTSEIPPEEPVDQKDPNGSRSKSRSEAVQLWVNLLTIPVLVFGLLELQCSRDQRAKESELSAWELLKAGEGKRANLGRRWALEYLDSRGQPLTGVNLNGAILPGLAVPGSNLSWSWLNHTHLSHGDLSGSIMASADLDSAVLEEANLRNAVLDGSWLRVANLHKSDLRGSVLSGAHFQGANLTLAVLDEALVIATSFRGANLNQASLAGMREWQSIRDIEMANIHGIKASAEFVQWALAHGAIDVEDKKAYRDSLQAKIKGGWDLWLEAPERN